MYNDVVNKSIYLHDIVKEPSIGPNSSDKLNIKVI